MKEIHKYDIETGAVSALQDGKQHCDKNADSLVQQLNEGISRRYYWSVRVIEAV